MSATLDNGLTASATFDFDVAEDNNGQDLVSGGYLLSVSSDMASLHYGDTSFAAETYWSSAGDMEADGFSEADGETVLRGEVMMAGITAGLSYAISDADGNIIGDNSADDVDQLSFGATGSFGSVDVAVAYQEESMGASGAYDPAGANGDFNTSEIFGVSASTTLAGADITVAYASNQTTEESSTGVKISYPFGPVTATAYYVSEDDNTDPDDNMGVNVAYSNGPIAVALDYQDDQGTTKMAIDGSYDLGNGLTALAGYYSQDNESGAPYEDEFYVAAKMDLGNGATFLVSYAEGVDNADDEIGGPDYQEGSTVEVSFEF